MDYGADDFKVAPNGKRKSYEVDYDSLSQSAVEKLIKEDVDYICSICGVDVSSPSLFVPFNPSMLSRFRYRKASQVYSCGI